MSTNCLVNQNSCACPSYGPDSQSGTDANSPWRNPPILDNSQPSTQTDDGDIFDLLSADPLSTGETQSDPFGYQGMLPPGFLEIVQALIALLMQMFGNSPGNSPGQNGTSSQKSMAVDGPPPVFTPSTESTEQPASETGFTQQTGENPDNLPNGNDRKVSFVNDGTEPMTLKFTPGAGEAAMPDQVIPPGGSATVQFPEGWSGNVRSTKGDGAATLLELTFDKDKTWANVSHIDGSNASMTIQNPGDPVKTGKMINLLEGAPEELLKYENGKAYGIKPSTVGNVTDQKVVDYLGSKIPVGDGYKYPTDDLSTKSFPTSNLVVHMANYV